MALPHIEQLAGERLQLTTWLCEKALPLWWNIGADRRRGGFFEKIDMDGAPVPGARRARVVARQIYAYATASRLGWYGPAQTVVEHGLSWLFQHCVTTGQPINSVVNEDGTVLKGQFSLYDFAFALLALAEATRLRPRDRRLVDTAKRIRDVISQRAHPLGGYWDETPSESALQSNPHMHLLEASLAWAEVAPPLEREDWLDLADIVVALCFDRFVQRNNSMVGERSSPRTPSRGTRPKELIEPGHQFEWAWLLIRWAAIRDSPGEAQFALRLIANTEIYGVDASRNLATNTLWEDFSVRDFASRLWPQTERIKANLAAAGITSSATEFETATARAAAASRSLRGYLDVPIAGLWWETINACGTPEQGPARASSLYHLVGCIAELNRERLAR